MARGTTRKTPSADLSDAAQSPLPPLVREVGAALGLNGLTLLLFVWVFPPGGVWPFAFVCLAPWLVATCAIRRAWLVHWSSFLFGWAIFMISLRWLMPVTGLGYAALCFYLALYWPLAGWAIRTGQRHGVAPWWTLPVVWVACEYLRAWVMTGFPWLFISHGLYRQLPFIQISDLVGAYGVTFAAVLVSGAVAGVVLWRLKTPTVRAAGWQLWGAAGAAALIVLASLAYGSWRIRQADFRHGPRAAVIQHDFPLESKPPYGQPPPVVFAAYVTLAAEATAEQPDVVIFPETVWAAAQNVEFLEVEQNAVDDIPASAWVYGKICHEAISAFAQGDYAGVNGKLAELEARFGHDLPRIPRQRGPAVPVILGATSIETFPEATYPKMKRFNSALVYDPDGHQRDVRYDKNHLVPFGEFVPFRYGRLHWLYRWLNKLSPFSAGGKVEYSLTPGDEFTIFELETKEGVFRFGIPICYEDVMPYVIREFAWDGRERRADFLVSISNDGWFLYGNELPQHLAICAFRAVENRVGIARAVNTGISGFIDPNGRVFSAVEDDGRRVGPGIVGYRVDHVLLDDRSSFYGRTGDWFAALCLVATVALWGVAIFERWILALRERIAAWRRKGAARNAPRH